MAEPSRDEDTIDDLIAALERAPSGSAELDRMVAFQLGLPLGESDQMIKLLLFEGYGWDVISELVQSENPSFTTALDARIPGENVVLAMRSAKRGQWAAIHRSAGGTDFIAWAASEALARRAAALRGLRAVSAFDARPAAAPPGLGRAASQAQSSPAGATQGNLPEAERPDVAPALPPDSTDGGLHNGEWKILF